MHFEIKHGAMYEYESQPSDSSTCSEIPGKGNSHTPFSQQPQFSINLAETTIISLAL